MPDAPNRRFAVACKACGRALLLKVERICDPEIAMLEAHLRVCQASEALGAAPHLGEIMRRNCVAFASPGSS